MKKKLNPSLLKSISGSVKVPFAYKKLSLEEIIEKAKKQYFDQKLEKLWGKIE